MIFRLIVKYPTKGVINFDSAVQKISVVREVVAKHLGCYIDNEFVSHDIVKFGGQFTQECVSEIKKIV